ncbi:SDR family NAD(P)-dependent oxidoreductase [Pseudochryseolinea flava]|nr:SDR family oxidoreductase [Pseudochryseolinea flava]
MKRLENKVAVIYGNGGIGGAIAKAFAREGARIFLAGRTQTRLDEISAEIQAANGSIATAVLDALDEQAVRIHIDKIVSKTGVIDISFNTIGLPQTGIQGIALANLSVENFLKPICIYAQSHFITAKCVLPHMIKQHQGVILSHVPNASRQSAPYVGGMIPAWSSLEALSRSISLEYGQQGVRSICMLSTGIEETPLIDEVWSIHSKVHGLTLDQFYEASRSFTHRKRLTTLKEFTDAAVFAASDDGSAITGTLFNLTAGMIVH